MARRSVFAVLACVLALAGLLGSVVGAAADGDDDQPLTIKVSGNRLVDGVGRPLSFAGVNRSGTEYMCARGTGIFDGPSDDASVHAIAGWHLNIVRVPLNESCWLGLGDVPAQYAGAAYRSAILDYVLALHRSGMFAELSLDGSGAMPDAAHAGDFWRSVAATFRDDGAVMFGLYGTPHDVGWTCWRDGGAACPGTKGAAGMQTLLDAVRTTGARQVIAVSGIGWGNDLSRWLQYRPKDALRSVVAEVHVFDQSACRTVACWRATLLPVAAKVPVVTGELGVIGCRRDVLDSYIPFARGNGISYLAWTWNTPGGCSALIAGYDGVPTALGFVYREQVTAPTPPPGAAAPLPPPPANSPYALIFTLIAAGVVIAAATAAYFVRRRRPPAAPPAQDAS